MQENQVDKREEVEVKNKDVHRTYGHVFVLVAILSALVICGVVFGIVYVAVQDNDDKVNISDKGVLPLIEIKEDLGPGEYPDLISLYEK